MKKIYRTLLPIIILVFTHGCQNQVRHPIAVIDIEKISTRTGQLKIIEEKTEAFTKYINTQLNQLKSDLNDQLIAEKAAFGKKPTKKDLEKLQASTHTAQLKLQLEITKAKQIVANKQSELVQDFRRQIEPAINQVAQQKGVDIVFLNKTDIVYTRPNIDITNEVIRAIQALPTNSKITNSP